MTARKDPSNAHYWERRYQSNTRVWSGEPNAALVQTVSPLTPGVAADLGCGEGADSIWLAERGWKVFATDISKTAIQRGEAEAHRRKISSDAISWKEADLMVWQPKQAVDLALAAYLHFPGTGSRYRLIRAFADCVKPGGHLLVLSHATFPPDRILPDHLRNLNHKPVEELSRLGLDTDQWKAVICERYPRPARTRGHDQADPSVAEDNVLLLRRTLSSSA